MRWWPFTRSQTSRAREAELSGFRAEVEAAAGPQAITAGRSPLVEDGLLERLTARAEELALTEDDGALELELLDGLRALTALLRAVEGDGLPRIETQHRVIAGEACRFSAPATHLVDAARTDGASGRLFLTDRRALFLGPSVTGMPWPSIGAVARVGRDLVLSGATRRHQFRFNTFADALCAAWLAERLR